MCVPHILVKAGEMKGFTVKKMSTVQGCISDVLLSVILSPNVRCTPCVSTLPPTLLLHRLPYPLPEPSPRRMPAIQPSLVSFSNSAQDLLWQIQRFSISLSSIEIPSPRHFQALLPGQEDLQLVLVLNNVFSLDFWENLRFHANWCHFWWIGTIN